jgi:hypothetical protein
MRGYQATTIRCLTDKGVVPGQHTLDDTPEEIDEEAMGRANDFVLDLLRQLDRDVGRRTPSENE